jgi:hypothetical protein
MINITMSQKRAIGRLLRERYDGARNVRFERDGAVNVTVDEMPNTNQSGRIFAGWDIDLLREAEEMTEWAKHPQD